jgi:hypothetical protein
MPVRLCAAQLLPGVAAQRRRKLPEVLRGQSEPCVARYWRQRPATRHQCLELHRQQFVGDQSGERGRTVDGDDTATTGGRDDQQQWRPHGRSRKELAQAIANGTANTCVTCGKMMVNGHDQYRRVPWHGMQPTGDMLCDACWEAENAQSPLLTLQAMQKAVANRAHPVPSRGPSRATCSDVWSISSQSEQAEVG